MLFWIDILKYDIGFAYKEGGMLTNYQCVTGKYANLPTIWEFDF